MDKDFTKHLTDEQKRVLRDKGTERPFSGKYVDEKGEGMYVCVACGNRLFDSVTKFASGSGWPSFDQAIPGSIKLHEDTSHGMFRTEVTCAQCGGHLGHVFPDGPTSTGERYCINSVCLDLKPKQ